MSMQPGRDFAPCPHCSAANITARSVCWRCGTPLLYTCDSRGKIQCHPESAPPTPQAIDALLRQAEVIQVERRRRPLPSLWQRLKRRLYSSQRDALF